MRHWEDNPELKRTAIDRGVNVAPGTASRSAPSEQLANLPLFVLFTGADSTLSALQSAAHLANELNADIRILIPYVVPYPLPIEKAQVHPEFQLREFISRCEHQPVRVRIDIWLCRTKQHCILDGLPPQSLVVIGGRSSRWPFSYGRRLARQLNRAGHRVILCSVSPSKGNLC